MNFQTFTGATLADVFREAHDVLGEDAAVVDTRMVVTDTGRRVQIVAVREREVERFRGRLDPGPLPVAVARADGTAARPVVVAVVGPTGAGKTTTVAKMALNARAFGGRRVGLLTLDTFRVGALEQIQTYAEIAGLPLEVVYHAREVPDALARLAGCDLVLVDTPGRGPRAAADDGEWREIVAAIAPAEMHLVLPASLRPDIAEAVRDAYIPLGVTHLLLSKLDEVPGEAGVTDLVYRLDLPARWVADGQEVPTDLCAAAPRIMASLGRNAPVYAFPAVA
jgi:flagellar biosynthesis protein FlhF